MIFSYRARQRLKRLLTMLLHILLVAMGLVLCWLLWLQRFVVYTPEGAYFDFDIAPVTDPAVIPTRPDRTDISIEYVGEKAPDQEEQEDVIVQIEWLDGYYIDTDTLIHDATSVIPLLEQLPAGTPVLVDVKNFWGYYYCTCPIAASSSLGDVAKVDELFAYLGESDLYTIARFPALRDYDFADKDYSLAIWKTSGGVYTDENRGLWLDPTKEATLSHLIQIIKYFRGMGFDEVLLQNFQIPEGENINYSNQTAVLEATAQSLVTACASDQFMVSFVASSQFSKIPETRSRLFLMNVAAADVEEMLQQAQVSDPDRQIVIIADTYDTRYDICNTLHPLDQAH